jgi:uncharacterized membrane protein
VVQAAILAAGALPVYWLAKRHLGGFAAVVFLALYVTYPPLIGMGLNDFHPESFLSTFMLYSMYFTLDKRWKQAVPFVLLTLSVIEEAGVLVAGLMVFAFIYHRAWRDRKAALPILAIAVASVSYSALAVQLPVLFGLDPKGLTLTLNSEDYSALGAASAIGIPSAILSYRPEFWIPPAPA